MISLGHLLLACGLAGLGLLNLISGDFAFIWQPLTGSVPFREALARLSGSFLFICGLGMLLRRTSLGSTLLMTVYLLSWVLMREVPTVAHAPMSEVVWLGVAESVMLVCGCWVIIPFILERDHAGETSLPYVRLLAKHAKGTPRLLIGFSCLILGLSHFVFAEITAKMVPAWLPGHDFFTYTTGIGHFAAGFGILLAIVPRLAATLEASMLSSFALLVQLPGVLSAPSAPQQWMKLLVTTALAGSVWALAHSLRGTDWILPERFKTEVHPI